MPTGQALPSSKTSREYSGLTSLGTWQWLQRHLLHALDHSDSQGAKGALLIGDLDRFSMLNGSLGYETGDRVLQNIAGRLRIGLDDTVVLARTRGDEFMVLASDLRLTGDPARLAERVQQIIDEPIELPCGREIHLSITIGIGVFPADGANARTVMQAADTALRRAREEMPPSGYYFYDTSQTKQAHQRLELERQLYRAVEGGELVTFYQPIVDIETGRIGGAEALVRWQHPERGLLAPGEFIAVAETSGLINALGARMLENACRDLARWRSITGADLSVAVNLSAHQFRSGHVISDVERALEDSGIPPGRLTLEITETTLMEKGSKVTQAIRRLKRIGTRLAIDDFGTGYSSLAYVQQFKADLLKVDRSFIRALPADPDSKQIVAAVLALSHGLAMDVIIEGIETEAQRASLHALGARRFQGYLASAPVDATTFEQMLHSPDALLGPLPAE